jgi:hypothetical protein
MKKLLLIIAAIAVTIGVFAFTQKEQKQTQVLEHWEFIGNNDLDAKDADNYRKITSTQTFVCDDVDYTVCTILAPEDPNSNSMDPRPLFSSGTNPVDDPGDYQATRRSLQ